MKREISFKINGTITPNKHEIDIPKKFYKWLKDNNLEFEGSIKEYMKIITHHAYFDANGFNYKHDDYYMMSFIILDEKKEKTLASSWKMIKTSDIQVAEYSALIFLLEEIINQNISCVEIKGDSRAVTEDAMGTNRLKKTYEIYRKSAQKFMEKLEYCRVLHIPRESNKLADELGRKAIEKLLASNP